MRRVVITGLGAVSCIGNNKAEILDSLRNGRSGIVANEIFKEMGLRSQVFGHCNIDFKEHIDRKILRFMGGAAAYAYIAMQECIDDAGLEESDVSNIRTGLIAGSGGASSSNVVKAADTLRARRAQDRAIRRNKDNGQYRCGLSCNPVQNQGSQLRHYLSVCD
jgi:3-oxoacyl-[acyl-carrier-protein] synthase-1